MNRCHKHKFIFYFAADSCPLCDFVHWLQNMDGDGLRQCIRRGGVNSLTRPAWRRPIYATGHVLNWQPK
jgi:hypothetical protein